MKRLGVIPSLWLHSFAASTPKPTLLVDCYCRSIYRLAKMAAPPNRAPMAMPAVGMAPAPSEELLVAVLPDAEPDESELEPSVAVVSEPDVSVPEVAESSVAVAEESSDPDAADVALEDAALVAPVPADVAAVAAEVPVAVPVTVRRSEATCERMDSWMLLMRSPSLEKAELAASWAEEAAAMAEESTAGVVCWA